MAIAATVYLFLQIVIYETFIAETFRLTVDSSYSVNDEHEVSKKFKRKFILL